jgi:hypothetical protein
VNNSLLIGSSDQASACSVHARVSMSCAFTVLPCSECF